MAGPAGDGADGYTVRPATIGMGEIHLADQPEQLPSQTAKINGVWVDPGYRRRGLAGAMAETMLVFAVSRGIGHIWLDWVDGNREAEGLWRSLGFVPAVVRAVLAQSGAAER